MPTLTNKEWDAQQVAQSNEPPVLHNNTFWFANGTYRHNEGDMSLRVDHLPPDERLTNQIRYWEQRSQIALDAFDAAKREAVQEANHAKSAPYGNITDDHEQEVVEKLHALRKEALRLKAIHEELAAPRKKEEEEQKHKIAAMESARLSQINSFQQSIEGITL